MVNGNNSYVEFSFKMKGTAKRNEVLSLEVVDRGIEERNQMWMILSLESMELIRTDWN